MPTETDMKLAEGLSDFRVEVSERFGKLEAGIAEQFGKVDARFAAVEKELAIIRKLGAWLLTGVFGLVAALLTGSFAVGWAASSMTSKTEQQGARLDAFDKRLDAMDRKLDTLINRTAPKAGG